MLLLLAVPIFLAVASLHRCLAQNAPSNILMRRVRSAPPRWRTAAELAALAAGVMLLLRVVEIEIGAGGPGWLNLVALVLAWDAVKLTILAVATGLRATFARHPQGAHQGPPRQAFLTRT
jgi:hypothetical protein